MAAGLVGSGVMGAALLWVALLGAAIGSFVNVAAHRVPQGQSVVTPRSACPQCGRPIRARDNVPVLSWVLLRGRCRDCAARIPARYPLVEILVTGLFAALAWQLGHGVLNALQASEARGALAALTVLLTHWAFAGIGTALALIDLQTSTLPNKLVAALLFSGLAGFTLAAALSHGTGHAGWGDLYRAVGGAAILFGGYLIIHLIRPDGMGAGDVKLAAAVGLFLGWHGWGALAVGGIAAFAIGSVLGVAAALRRESGTPRRKTAIPFGPSMLAGAMLGIFAGEPLARLYLQLFGLA